MVNVSESLINTVKLDEPKQLAVSGSAKRHGIGCPPAWCGHADMASPVERRDRPNSVTCTERGKPVWAFFNNEAIHNAPASRETGRGG